MNVGGRDADDHGQSPFASDKTYILEPGLPQSTGLGRVSCEATALGTGAEPSAAGKSERDPSATPAGVEPGGLARQVVALGEVGCLLGRLCVQPCRRRQVAVALVEVRRHRGVAGQ
jgi:hypothetical protein